MSCCDCQKHLRGPVDGPVGEILTCCHSKISVGLVLIEA